MSNQIKYVSVAELAEMLSVTKTSIYHFIKHEGMPAGVRFGKARRFSLTEIKDWLNTKKVI